MKLIFPFFALLFLSACSSKKDACSCEMPYGKFEKLESGATYCICDITNGRELLKTDSVNVSIIPDSNAVISNVSNVIFFLQLNPGNFTAFDQSIHPDVREVITKMHKGSVAFVKIAPLYQKLPLSNQILVFFKTPANETVINRWLSSIKEKYTDSVVYTSSAKALAQWEDENDTAWKAMIKENPLPALAELYLKAASLHDPGLDSLKAEWEKLPFISEVNVEVLKSVQRLEVYQRQQKPITVKITAN